MNQEHKETRNYSDPMVQLKVITIKIKLCNQALVQVKQLHLLFISYWSRLDSFLNSTSYLTILKEILEACLAWISPLNIYLIPLAPALVIGWIATCNESCSVACWFSSFTFVGVWKRWSILLNICFKFWTHNQNFSCYV